ncbi:MAG: multiubiquitin domain-containing protein [Phycisphaera sp.]|nr:MAG: multiubiquitin domain-containing protein [Phycisphaera sp.]
MAEHKTDELNELDIEQYTKSNPSDQKPDARVYIIRIDREVQRVSQKELSGEEILQLVQKSAQTHKLFQKLRGREPEEIDANQTVSFVAPGVERFMTIPLDTTEGSRG